MENEDNIENENLSYAIYNGQKTAMRRFAVKEIGADKVAMMSDDDIQDWLREKGFIPLCVMIGGLPDQEHIYIVNKSELNKMTCFSR